MGFNVLPNLGLFGKSGAGKSTVARILCDNYGYKICNTGRWCRQISLALFGDDSTEHLHQISDALRSIDSSIFLKGALRHLDKDKPCVIDSVRHSTDIALIKPLGFFLVKVEITDEKRIDRLQNRGQIYDLQRDVHHVVESEAVSFVSDFVVPNAGNEQALRRHIGDLLGKLSSV
jgi:dephospho-CoA kinase